MSYSARKRESSRTKVPMTDNDDLFGGETLRPWACAATTAATIPLSAIKQIFNNAGMVLLLGAESMPRFKVNGIGVRRSCEILNSR